MADARRRPAPSSASSEPMSDDADDMLRDAAEHPTVPLPPVDPGRGAPDRSTVARLFGSGDFFRLWLAQVVSALGDWLGFVAIVAIATRIGGASPAGAISIVMTARLVPGFFLAPLAGVLVDRWDRKRVMVSCDVVRALTLLTLPFIESLLLLVVASVVIEAATLLWSPAKEASVPNLVPAEHLTTANSLSLAAAYGTFPVATLLFAALAKLADWLGGFGALEVLRTDQASLAIYADVVTYLVAAAIVSTLALPPRPADAVAAGSADLGQTFRDLKEGWHFMVVNPTVRAVMLSVSTGLIGGGMLVPLGDVFSRQVLGGGSAGFGLILTALGSGMAGGVLGLSALQKRMPKVTVFCWAEVLAAVALALGAAMSTLIPALLLVAMLGVCAGTVYVLGFTILHETVADELRGRIFSTLYTLVRFCLLLAFAVGPLLADGLGALSDSLLGGSVDLGATTVALPGVRLALWFASVVILGAGLLAFVTLRENRAAQGRAEPT